MDMNDPRLRAYRERLEQINAMKRDVADYIRTVARAEARRVQEKQQSNFRITCNKCGAQFEFVYEGAGIPWIPDCPICKSCNNDKTTYQISAVGQNV